MTRRAGLVCVLLATIPWLSGCESTNARTVRHASVVDYLYANAKKDPSAGSEAAREVTLEVPLRVAVGFAPRAERSSGSEDGFGEVHRRELLKRIVASFQGLPEVQSVDVLPTSALTPGGGFGNLERAAGLFDANVVALISYEQLQFNDDNPLSLLYITIVGSWLFPGTSHETQTLLDASVFDLGSRTLLFNAMGSSRGETLSTAVGASRAQRRTSMAGFEAAADDLVASLERSIEGFRRHVADGTVRGLGTPSIEVRRLDGRGSGGTGAGAFGGVESAAATLMLLGLRATSRRRRHRRLDSAADGR